jgi:hypothetical protein
VPEQNADDGAVEVSSSRSAEPSPRIHLERSCSADDSNASLSRPPLQVEVLRRQLALAKMDVSSWISQQLLPALVDEVVLARSCERGVNQFQRHRTLNGAFRRHLSETLLQLLPNQAPMQRVLLAHLLVACKVAAEQGSLLSSTGHTDAFKRKQHALKVVEHLLADEHCIALFHRDRFARLVLRRHVCTSVLEACVSIVPSVFQRVLRVFGVLWTRYRRLLKAELGVILDAILLAILESKRCWPEQKCDLIDAVSRLFQTPQSLVSARLSPTVLSLTFSLGAGRAILQLR